MIALSLILLIAAAVCFLLVALSVASPKINLLGLGLFLWTLSILLGQALVVIK